MHMYWHLFWVECKTISASFFFLILNSLWRRRRRPFLVVEVKRRLMKPFVDTFYLGCCFNDILSWASQNSIISFARDWHFHFRFQSVEHVFDFTHLFSAVHLVAGIYKITHTVAKSISCLYIRWIEDLIIIFFFASVWNRNAMEYTVRTRIFRWVDSTKSYPFRHMVNFDTFQFKGIFSSSFLSNTLDCIAEEEKMKTNKLKIFRTNSILKKEYTSDERKFYFFFFMNVLSTHIDTQLNFDYALWSF